MKEIRSFDFEVRAEVNDQGSVLTGQPIVYDERTNLGWYDEIIDNGSLADTDLRDVRFLINHNTDMIPCEVEKQQCKFDHADGDC